MENIIELVQAIFSNPLILLAIIALFLGREISFGDLKIGGKKTKRMDSSLPSAKRVNSSPISKAYKDVRNFIGSAIMFISFLIIVFYCPKSLVKTMDFSPRLLVYGFT